MDCLKVRGGAGLNGRHYYVFGDGCSRMAIIV